MPSIEILDPAPFDIPPLPVYRSPRRRLLGLLVCGLKGHDPGETVVRVKGGWVPAALPRCRRCHAALPPA